MVQTSSPASGPVAQDESLANGLTFSQMAEIESYTDRLHWRSNDLGMAQDSLSAIEHMKDLIDLMARAMARVVEINTTLK